MDVAVKTIMKKNIPKTQSLLKKEIDILRVNIFIILDYCTSLLLVTKIFLNNFYVFIAYSFIHLLIKLNYINIIF